MTCRSNYRNGPLPPGGGCFGLTGITAPCYDDQMITTSEHQQTRAAIAALPLSYQLDVLIRLIRWQLRCDTETAFVELAQRIHGRVTS